MAVFNFISDDSHGWLAVSLTEYPEAKKFATGFGYINGNTIYLEEDDEATGFINYLKELGETISFNEKNYNGQWYGRAYARNVSGQ
jgi:hypothetical protein